MYYISSHWKIFLAIRQYGYIISIDTRLLKRESAKNVWGNFLLYEGEMCYLSKEAQLIYQEAVKTFVSNLTVKFVILNIMVTTLSTSVR